METKNIKYTTDGKKVVVLGNLNSQEKIVQEIFVVDNSEIPSGEHFVVKSLHDAPTVSWKEKHLHEIEEKYEKTHKQKNEEYEKMLYDFDFKTKIIKEKLSFLRKLETSFNKQKLEQFIDFISGDIKYIVVNRYGYLEISEYDSSIATKEYGRFESVKLLSVFGKTDGDLEYKMNQYYDGSGSWTNIHPFKTKEDALEFLKEMFDEKIKSSLDESLIKLAEQYKFDIPTEIMKKYKSSQKENLQKRIDVDQKRLDDLKNELSSI